MKISKYQLDEAISEDNLARDVRLKRSCQIIDGKHTAIATIFVAVYQPKTMITHTMTNHLIIHDVPQNNPYPRLTKRRILQKYLRSAPFFTYNNR